MTSPVTEMPTTRLRWHNGKLEQLWHIQTCAKDSHWVMKEEWREVPSD